VQRRPGAPLRFSIAALLERAGTSHARGLLAAAEQLYRSVLEREPANFEAHHMLGIIALQEARPDEGVALIRKATMLNPRNAPAQANLANALVAVQRTEEALRHYQRALQLDPRSAAILANQGSALQLLDRHTEAAGSFARLLELAPQFDFALGSRFRSLRHSCDWQEFEARRAEVIAAVEAGRRADRPFSFLSVCDSTTRQRDCARIYAGYLCPAEVPALWRGERYSHERLRVAYLSADFRDHVVSHMMAPVFERHDARRFEVIGLSLRGDDDSPIVRRIRSSLARFIELGPLSDHQAAELMRSLEIDVAIDLTGFTQGCRPGILARRAAPVQVSLLGFPATMGVPCIDYLIADDFSIPPELEAGYSEKIVRLPGCFQPNDERHAVRAVTPPTRAEAGLPASGLVLCSFNNSYKLNPRFFAIWMRVMQAVPDSILWLLAGDAGVGAHLRSEAAARGIASERLVFAPRVPYAGHLARLRLADLFLDTLPFNAGATAGDALWAGVPLLTCAGEAFAARMAGSLLRALALPELITFSETEYQERAIELAGNPTKLAELRARLTAGLGRADLFDSSRYCRRLEAAYLAMSERAARGEPPASFSVVPQS
jgi:protein O-GlcNAc transferase